MNCPLDALLGCTLLVEPDFQRLARFILQAVEALDGDVFRVCLRLNALLQELRKEAAQETDPLEVTLRIRNRHLQLAWANRVEPLTELPDVPGEEVLRQLAEKLTTAFEAADAALLKQRNAHIRAALESAQQRAAAVERLEQQLAHKQQELQRVIRQAEIDSLTGIYNRGAFDYHFPRMVRSCQRQNQALSLILFDLDYFKQVNDEHGHQYGDKYLKKMAGIMQGACREDVDLPCRIGGDEFAMIVMAEEATAGRIAARILQQMEQRVSIGYGMLQPQDSDMTLLQRCDAALYRAKAQGRGRIMVDSGPPLAAPALDQ